MEELTKTQLILLALLVSFITSIATGIVTVTLLDQAPPGVTQTINRVVERTVEKVVPGQEASVITKETTVVVKEENLIVSAVDKNSKNLIRIFLVPKEQKEEEEVKPESTLGIGVIISSDGLIVTDSLNLTESKVYLIKNSNKTYSANLEKIDAKTGLAFLRIIQSADTETQARFSKPSFGDTSNLKLGQTVVAIGGLGSNTVATGIISKLNTVLVEAPTEAIVEGDKNKEPKPSAVEVLSSINSNMSISPDYSGGPLLDVDGFLLGINMKRKDGDFTLPINIVLDISSKKLENTDTTVKKS